MKHYKYFGIVMIFALLAFQTFAQSKQEMREGHVSFVSSQNIYVSFLSTSGMNSGDTLFVQQNGLQPALIINQLSSISCITEALPNIVIERDTKVFARVEAPKINTDLVSENKVESDSIRNVKEDRLEQSKALEKDKREEKIYGRVSVKAYSNLSTSFTDNTRLRYTVSLNGEHLQQSKVGTDLYLVFTHRIGEWNKVQENLFSALKIYSLAFKYDFNEDHSVWFGRKINPNLANIGAIDGLQYEGKHENLSWGVALGTRPDYLDYSFNSSLVQMGAYLSHKFKNENGNASTSIAFFNQNNGAKTDRRFIYFQHANNLIDKLNLFTSCEVDLYQLVNGVPSNSLQLTGLYASLRYKPTKTLSLHTSYDARKNVIYYETFKNLADLILDNETRQGFRAQVMYRPFKSSMISSTAGYRYKKGDIQASKNVNSYFSYYGNLWFVDNLSINHTWLNSSYLIGNQYALNFSRDFNNANLYSTLNLRVVDYQFKYNDSRMFQKIANFSLNWKLKHYFQVSVDYEATFDETFYSNIYCSLIKRFK